MLKGLGGLGDMGKMMKAAQEMQTKMAELQESLAPRKLLLWFGILTPSLIGLVSRRVHPFRNACESGRNQCNGKNELIKRTLVIL